MVSGSRFDVSRRSLGVVLLALFGPPALSTLGIQKNTSVAQIKKLASELRTPPGDTAYAIVKDREAIAARLEALILNA